MAIIELLIDRAADRNAVRELLEDRYDVRTNIDRGSGQIGESDLYLVDVRNFSTYQDGLQARIQECDPVFCPVALIRQPELTGNVSPAQPDEQSKPMLIDEFLDPPLTRSRLLRRVESLLARRKQSLELQRERNELRTFRQVVEHSGHAIVVTDPDGTIEYVNPAFEALTDYSTEEAIGRNPRLLKSGEHGQRFYEQLWGTITNGKVWYSEIVNQRKDGERFVVDQTIAPVFDEAGDILRFVAVNHDVTDRNKRKRELEQYETIVETAADAIYKLDVEGRFTRVNQQTVEMTGYDRDELLGNHVSLVLNEPDIERGRRLIRELLLTSDRTMIEYEATVVTESGETFPVDLRIAPLVNDGTLHGTVGLVRDITEHKQTEERRRRLLDATRTILEKTDRESVIEFTADVTAGILGFSSNVVRLREEGVLVPAAVSEQAHVHLGDRPAYPLDPDDNPAARAFARSEPVVVDDFRTLEDGYDRGGAISGIYIPVGDFGVLSAIELEPSAFDTSDVELAMILGANAESALHRVEYERTLQKQRDRLEMLNQVMRHDIRNDLQLINAYAEETTAHVDEKGKGALEIVTESAENAIDLTKTAGVLADVMLQSETDNRSIALLRTLEQQIEEIRLAHPGAEVAVDGSLPAVNVQANELLDAVFRNLLKNAILHNDKDVPRVSVSAQANDDRATIRIADNGPGVPDAHKRDLFGKGEKGLDSEGTGIGLYLVSELVSGYQGDVWIEDNRPEGAVFVIELPVAT